MMEIYIVVKHVYDHEMVKYTEPIKAFRIEEEAHDFKASLNLPWQLEVQSVEFEDYATA